MNLPAPSYYGQSVVHSDHKRSGIIKLERFGRITLTLALSIGIAGCASTNVQRGKDLSTVGVQYAKATSSLIDVATNTMIDADSEAQVRVKLPVVAMTGERQKEFQTRLETLNQGLAKNTKVFLLLRASLSSTESYFAGLQALADNPQSDTAASAVATLSDRVNALNDAIKKGEGSIKPVMSDAQKTALSGLSKLVADQVHGAKVGGALRRDAPIIGESLALQERILGIAELIISGALTDQNNRFLVDKVQRPFLKQDIDSAWVVDRNKYIKAKALGENSMDLQTTRATAKQMYKTWEKILSGDFDTSEMRAQIAEVEAIAAALAALKDAEKPKAPAQ